MRFVQLKHYAVIVEIDLYIQTTVFVNQLSENNSQHQNRDKHISYKRKLLMVTYTDTDYLITNVIYLNILRKKK